MAPRFSVLLPTHNRARLLRLALASLLAQTERDFEILVVGDGCTDDTAKVITGLADERIRWFDLPKAPHFGYANRNIALRQATGAYIAYMTDDDLAFPDHLALLASTLESTGAEWAYSRPLWVAADGLLVPFATNLLNADELEVFTGARNHIPSCCVVHRRGCLEKYGYWPENLPSAADWHYWVRIIEGGERANLACCPTPTMLHFNASWRVKPETQMPQVTVAREIVAASSWWPATLNVSFPPRRAEQEVFDELIRQDGYVERLRRDVGRVIDWLAWKQLDETPGIYARLRGEVGQAVMMQAQAERAFEVAEEKAVSARAELGAVRSTLNRTRDELGATVEELEQARAELATSRDESARLAQDLVMQREELIESTGRIAELREQIDALRHQLAAVYMSTSWRLAAPLRALRRMGRRPD